MRGKIIWLAVSLFVVAASAVVWGSGLLGGREPTPDGPALAEAQAAPSAPAAAGLQKATFGNGCFWCTEAVFQRLKGVQSVVSGYSGGWVKNPKYGDVCSGDTGHAEVIQITYDPAVISYSELLEVFWKTHDPTTKDRQGPDRGTQYRSAVFYHNEEQKTLAEQYKKKLDASGAFNAPIVTEIVACTTFYPAEDYHQNYFASHPGHPYCMMQIPPKLEKLEKVFKDKLKPAPAR